jgi:hypothetical protein
MMIATLYLGRVNYECHSQNIHTASLTYLGRLDMVDQPQSLHELRLWVEPFWIDEGLDLEQW